MKAVYLSTNGDQTTVLPFPLEVQGFGCGVFEMNGKVFLPRNQDNGNKNKKDIGNLYLCCNIVEESFVRKIKIPVLQCIKRKNGVITGVINKIIWLKVMRPTISTRRLYICDEQGELVSLPHNRLNCTLLFVPDPTA